MTEIIIASFRFVVTLKGLVSLTEFPEFQGFLTGILERRILVKP